MLKSTKIKEVILCNLSINKGLDVFQDMQTGLDRESSSLMDLESQKQLAQQRLEEMDQQHSKLEGMLSDVKQKCQEESHKVREAVFSESSI